jgi:hypothetical protein
LFFGQADLQSLFFDLQLPGFEGQVIVSLLAGGILPVQGFETFEILNGIFDADIVLGDLPLEDLHVLDDEIMVQPDQYVAPPHPGALDHAVIVDQPADFRRYARALVENHVAHQGCRGRHLLFKHPGHGDPRRGHVRRGCGACRNGDEKENQSALLIKPAMFFGRCGPGGRCQGKQALRAARAAGPGIGSGK